MTPLTPWTFVLVLFLLGVGVRLVVGWLAWREQFFLRNMREKRGRKGYIYIFRGRRENPLNVKIGRARHVHDRMRSHRTANPYGVIVLFAIQVADDVTAEKYLHSKFDAERFRGRDNEWFHLSPRLLLYIRLVRDRALTEKVNHEL